MYSQTGGLVATPPAFLFVVDTCVTEEDLEGLRNNLKQLLELMPQTALVGLISYGTMVQVRILSAHLPVYSAFCSSI
jgi:protein transport protein SEC23